MASGLLFPLLALAILPRAIGQDPCVAPTTIPFAAQPPCAEGDIIGFLATCTPRCQDGFTPVVSGPDTVLVCGFSGQLSPAVFACTEEVCPSPTGIAHVHPAGACAQGPTVTSRDVCVSQCDHGYYPSHANLSCYRGNLTPPTFRCIGLPCTAPEGIPFGHPVSSCAERKIFHDKQCTTRCSDGYAPSIPTLNCSLGNLTPSTFACLGLPCLAPLVPNAASPSCREGVQVPHFGLCTTRCSTGYGPSIPTLSCTATQLSPPDFVCLGLPCAAPANITNSVPVTCAEGPEVPHGGSCTTQCAAGYVSSVATLSCSIAALSPPNFTCVGLPCEMPLGIPNGAEETCEEGRFADHMGNCTGKCAFGYAPSVPVMYCHATILSPPAFSCIGLPCDVPANISNAAPEGPCAEGANISHGGICTAQCAPGYVPMTPILVCNASTFRPSLFDCVRADVLAETVPAKGAIVSLGTVQQVAAAPLSKGRALVCYKDLVWAGDSNMSDSAGHQQDVPGLRVGRCSVIYASVASVQKGPSVNISSRELVGLALVQLAEDRLLACYHLPELADRGVCRLLDVANTSLALSVELEVCAGPAWHLAVARLSDDSAVVCCQGAPSLGCRVLTATGLMLAAGPVSVVGNNASAAFLALAQLREGRAVACLSDAMEERRVFCYVLSAFGTSLVADTGIAVSTGAAYYVTMAPMGNGKAALCYSDWDASELCRCSLLVAHGSGGGVLAEASSLVVLKGLTRHQALAPLRDGQAVVCYQYEAWFGRSYGHCSVLNARGNTSLEAGGDVVVNAGTTWNLAVAALGPDTALVCFSDTSHSEYGKCIVLWGLREWILGEASVCSTDPSEPLCTIPS